MPIRAALISREISGLLLHHAAPPPLLLPFGDPRRKGRGRRSLFAGVGEDPEVVETDLPDEGEEVLEPPRGLPREAHDERGPQGDAGDDRPGRADDLPDQRAVAPPVHGREDRVVAVLDGDVEVVADLLLIRDRPEELFRQAGRVGIEEADPGEAVDGGELA